MKMRNSTRLIIGLAACIAAFSAISCSKDNTLHYNNVTMGNIVDGVFVTDQGNEFKVVEQTCPGRLDTMKRAFTVCDILQKTSGNEYEVRMNHIANVLVKDAVPSSELTDMEAMANDPILLPEIWISGGYVNMHIILPVNIDKKKQKPHKITFIRNMEDEGEYRFRIMHDGNGEVLDSESGNMALAGAYASFPVSTVIKEEKATIILEWNSYVQINGGGITAQSKAKKIGISYSRE